MNAPIESRLMDILACPDCGAPLAGDGDGLSCLGCRRSYELCDNIPVLLPGGFDGSHLEEEKKLGGIMTSEVPAGESFSEQQWEASKEEFWGSVRERISGRSGLTILNAGCGVDRKFLELQEGNFLVGFDLMCGLLSEMRDRHGSKFNIAGTVESLPFREGSFDCVCCIDLIHHEIRDIPSIIAGFYRVLRPGGALFLEDINAWALFQIWKSILLPRSVHGKLRTAWHRMKGSSHAPAPYEFPTSVFSTIRELSKAGFTRIEAIPQRAYPNSSKAMVSVYRTLSGSKRVRKYHNFHYMLYAMKAAGKQL